MNSTIFEYLTNPTSPMRWVNMSMFGKDPHSTDKVENLIEDRNGSTERGRWQQLQWWLPVPRMKKLEQTIEHCIPSSHFQIQQFGTCRSKRASKMWLLEITTSSPTQHYLFYENTLKTDLTWGSTNEY